MSSYSSTLKRVRVPDDLPAPPSPILQILYMIVSVEDLVVTHVSPHVLGKLATCSKSLGLFCYEDNENVWKTLCRRDFNWTIFADAVPSSQIYQNLFANSGLFKLSAPKYKRYIGFIWSPDNRRLAGVTSNDEIYVWTVPFTQPSVSLQRKIHHKVEYLTWSPDGQLLAEICQGGILRILNAEDRLTPVYEHYNERPFTHEAQWSCNSLFIVTVDMYNHRLGSRLLLWSRNVDTSWNFHSIEPNAVGAFTGLYAVKWSAHNPDILAFLADNGRLCVWNVAKAAALRTLQVDNEPILDFEWSPLGQNIAYVFHLSYIDHKCLTFAVRQMLYR